MPPDISRRSSYVRFAPRWLADPMGVQLATARYAESIALDAAEVIEARAPKVEPIDPKF